MKIGISWTIDEELINKLKKLSIEKQRSESWMVNEILINYFKNSKGGKNGFRKE